MQLLDIKQVLDKDCHKLSLNFYDKSNWFYELPIKKDLCYDCLKSRSSKQPLGFSKKVKLEELLTNCNNGHDFLMKNFEMEDSNEIRPNDHNYLYQVQKRYDGCGIKIKVTSFEIGSKIIYNYSWDLSLNINLRHNNFIQLKYISLQTILKMIAFYREGFHLLNILPNINIRQSNRTDITTISTSRSYFLRNIYETSVKEVPNIQEIPVIQQKNPKAQTAENFPQNKSLLKVNSRKGSCDLEIPTTKDNFKGPTQSMLKLDEILSSQQLCLDHFKDWSYKQILEQGEYCSHSILKAVQFFLMDLLYSEHLINFKKIETFVEYQQFSIKPNAATNLSLQENGIQNYTDTQIKKLYFQYCKKKLEGQSTFGILRAYPVLLGVIEVVFINYLYYQLSKQKFQDFNQMYQQQNIIPSNLFQYLKKVFNIVVEERDKNIYALKLEKTSIIVRQEQNLFISKLQ